MTRERAKELKELVKAGLYFDDHTKIFTAFRSISSADRDNLLALIDAVLAKPVSNLCDHCFYAPSCEGADGTPAVSCNRFKEIELAKPVTSEDVQRAIDFVSKYDFLLGTDEGEIMVAADEEDRHTILTALSAYRKPSADAVCDEILWQEIFSLREKLKIAVEAIKSYDPKFDDKLFLHQLNSADYDQLMEELSGDGQKTSSADQSEIDRAIAIFQEHIDEAEAVVGHKPDCKYCKASRLAITALRAYQPKEPCDRKVTI